MKHNGRSNAGRDRCRLSPAPPAPPARGTRRSWAARRGAEVLEAALVFPLLLGLAFGTVEFGYYFYVEHNLSCAAREGARAGVPAGATDDEALDAVDRVMLASGYRAEEYESEIERGEDYLTVRVKMRWDDVNEGLRPLRLISRQDGMVQGIATMKIENYAS